ncbi:phosphatase PAP2 family protein [Flammeovirga agarivorans]|uniref:PAP2 superfamily protein n=1 Tax=Flammeovirga agarivorans TaxID=2726742 RepID=A0A7X8SIB7_9BACT|nr:hypothetical protein [Flammeovirga agarivorans]NLR90789.1 hypothetical protein [Flammeovirga agarivorans]
MDTKKFFQIISVVLHPIFLPCIIAGLFLFGANEAPWLDAKARWSLFTLLSTISSIMPISCLLVMQRFGVIKDPQMHSRDERSFALSIMIVALALICFILLHKINVSDNMSVAYISITFTLFVTTIANFIERISLHSMGVSGFIGICLYFITEQINTPIILFDAFGLGIIALGLIITARLYLNAHTPYQVYLGAVIGFLSGYFGCIGSAYLLF